MQCRKTAVALTEGERRKSARAPPVRCEEARAVAYPQADFPGKIAASSCAYAAYGRRRGGPSEFT